MYSLSSQNRSLMAKLQNTTDGSAGLQNGVVDNNNLSGHNESNAHIMTQPSPDSIQASSTSALGSRKHKRKGYKSQCFFINFCFHFGLQ